MEDILSSLTTYGYIVLFLYSLGGGFVALLAAGVLSYTGNMDLGLSMLIAFVANFVGDMGLFYMGRYNKGDIHNYLKKHRRKLAFSHILIKKHGYKVIFFQKFVYGIKTLIPLAIGITKYDFKSFAFFNLISSAIWAAIIGGIGYVGGEAVVKAMNATSGQPYIFPVILLSLLLLIWFYLNKVTSKKKNPSKK